MKYTADYRSFLMIRSEEDIWVFPASIDFEKAALYTKKYREQENRALYFFDLSATIAMHTSFIGFLLSVKHDLDKSGGRLILNTSREIEDLFAKMKLTDYFAASKSVQLLKKTA